MNTWTKVAGCAGIFLLGTALNAWTDEKPLHMGVRAGFQLHWMNSDPEAEGIEAGGGANAGLMVDCGLSEKLGLQGGAYFIQKGYKTAETTQAQSTNVDVNLNYLEIQALIRWSLKGGWPKGFYMLAGPSLGFQLSATQKTEINGSNNFHSKVTLDVSNFYKSTDLSFLTGLGYGFGKTGSFSLEARFLAGLTNIADIGSSDIRNQGISLLLGYNFGL